MSSKPRILFLSLFNDVGSDRIVASMGRLGAECGVLGATDAFAARSRFAGRLFKLPRFGGYWARSLFLGRRLAKITCAWRPDLVIPLDEFSARTLRDPRLHRKAGTAVRALLERSLGAPEHFAAIRGRHHLVDKATALGLATPRQQAVETIEAARAVADSFGYPVVLKREQTCGGAGVAIVHDAESLAEAFRRAAFKAAAKRWLQRLLGRAATDASPLVLQAHVPGPLAFRVVACANGVVLDGIDFLSECAHPAVTGASTRLRPIERSDMDAATQKLVAALGCSGFVSVDFILPPEGPAVLIEMNPRPVASGHLGQLFGHDIYAALLEQLAGKSKRPPPATAPRTIALFPRELDRDPRGRRVEMPSAVYHDVPWDDPGVVEAYAAWLEGRHPADGVRVRRLLNLAPAPRAPATHPRRVGGAASSLFEHLARYAGRLHWPASVK